MDYALIENGVVSNITVWDGVPFTPAVKPDENGEGGSPAFGWSPPDGVIAVLIEDGVVAGIGYAYDGSAFTAPPAPVQPPPSLAEKTSQRDALSAIATNQIAIYTDATDPDIVDTVDPKDTAALKAWKQYRVAVNKVDLTQSEPTWPQAPQS